VTDNSTALNYYLASTGLNSETVVVAYADAHQNNALVVQVIHVSPSSPSPSPSSLSPITFGSTWTVQSGQVFTALPTGYMDIDITKVSESDLTFTLLYSDLSNAGAMTLSMGQVLTSSKEVIRNGPDFMISMANPNAQLLYPWGALASGQTEELDSTTAVLTMFADSSNCENTAT
jgi:hypothetical protein